MKKLLVLLILLTISLIGKGCIGAGTTTPTTITETTITPSPGGGGGGTGPGITTTIPSNLTSEQPKVTEYVLHEGQSIEIDGKTLTLGNIDEYGNAVLVNVDSHKKLIGIFSRDILDAVGVEIKNIDLAERTISLSVTYPLADLIGSVFISPNDEVFKNVVSGTVNISASATSPYEIGDMTLTIEGKDKVLTIHLNECSLGVSSFCMDCEYTKHKSCMYEWNTSDFSGDVTLKVDVIDALGNKRTKTETIEVTKLSCDEYCKSIGYSFGECEMQWNGTEENKKMVSTYFCPKYYPPCELEKSNALISIGDRYSLSENDNITINGKTVILEKVNNTSAIFNVDGLSESIMKGNAKTINGITIYVVNLFVVDKPISNCPPYRSQYCFCYPKSIATTATTTMTITTPFTTITELTKSSSSTTTTIQEIIKAIKSNIFVRIYQRMSNFFRTLLGKWYEIFHKNE